MWRPPPPSIERLLAQHGLRDCRVRRVANLDCAVWRVQAAQADMALRIYAEERRDTLPIDTEIAWLLALADAGVHVPRPRADGAGSYRMRWQADAGSAARHAVLMDWLPGRRVYKGLRPVHLRHIGELAGRLHGSARQLVAARVLSSPRLAHTAEVAAWADGRRCVPEGCPAGLQASVQHAAKHLLALTSHEPRDVKHWGFIHGDLHPWNIVFHRGGAGAIDFTDSGWGHLAKDLAGVLQFLKHPLTPADAHHRTAYPRLRDALLEGYAARHDLPDSLVAQIDPLIAAGLLITLQWIVDDWPRLDHRAWGPWFLSRMGPALDEAFD